MAPLVEMAANALVQTRIDGTVKEEAATVLAAMGLTVSDPVRLMLTRNLVERACREPAPGETRVDGIEPELHNAMARCNAFDSRDFGVKIGEDGRLAHDVLSSSGGVSVPRCSYWALRVMRPLRRVGGIGAWVVYIASRPCNFPGYQ